MLYTTNQQIDLTIEVSEIAEMFCNMDSEQQAQFFNRVAKVAEQWDGQFEFQMAEVAKDEILTEEARRVMKVIGESVL